MSVELSGASLPSAHNSKLSQPSERQQESVLDAENSQSQPLARNEQEEQRFQMPKLQTILKGVFLVVIFGILIWMASSVLSNNSMKSRRPQSLGPTDGVKEFVSPDETDYRAYYYYLQVLKLANKYVSEGTKMKKMAIDQMETFDNITYPELLNLFQVVRTIKIAQNFRSVPPKLTQLADLNQTINFTDYFPHVVNQFRCASCYSFPVTATVEYLYRRQRNLTLKLSQQQLIDCAHLDPNANGCEDGNITRTFEYVRDVGLVSDEDYHYRSIEGQSYKCEDQVISQDTTEKYRISGFKILPYRNCKAIQDELLKGNVVAAMISVGELSSYVDGIFRQCNKDAKNHAITIVGMTQDNDWIVRNSWGKNWGEQGYFRVSKGNTCGICDYGIVPSLEFDENGTVVKKGIQNEQKDKN